MKKSRTITIISIFFISMLFNNITAFATTEEPIIVEDMLIDDTVEEFNDLPALNGIFESEPNQEQLETILNERDPIIENITPREITPEGYRRVYGSVVLSTYRKNEKYELLGRVSVYNSTSSKGRLDYKQDSTRTVNWQVSGNVSARGEVSLPFLSELEVSVGGSVGRSVTTGRSTSVTYSTDVPARSSRSIECYQVAAYGAGKIPWWDYRPQGGAPVRNGSDNVSGSAPMVNEYRYIVNN